jgi:Uma2 family endonuclease
MATVPRFTSRDLELLPEPLDATRYEIIDGELYVSTQPHAQHQYACSRLTSSLDQWDDVTGVGFTLGAPGLIFSPDKDVAPDLVWISRERYAQVIDRAGHLQSAPELVVEVLSYGDANEARDREVKLSLYSRQGVREYWIVDWRRQEVQVYRRRDATLILVGTLQSGDEITSPLVPGFACPVSRLWIPAIEAPKSDEEHED